MFRRRSLPPSSGNDVMIGCLYVCSICPSCIPQVVDGRDGLQIWRVAANILNKQSRTPNRGWSSSLGVGQGASNPPP
jgi:hypothetical protein